MARKFIKFYLMYEKMAPIVLVDLETLQDQSLYNYLNSVSLTLLLCGENSIPVNTNLVYRSRVSKVILPL